MPVLKNNKLVLTLVVSVIVHILLISLLYFTRTSNHSFAEQTTVSPISAQLYFYTPPAPEPEPVVSEIKEPEPVEPEIKEPEPAPEPILQDTMTKVEPPAKPIETPVSKEPLLTEQTEEDELPETNKEALPTAPSSLYQQPLQDIAKDQLQRYQLGKLDNLAAQAAKEYRRQKNSPVLPSKAQDGFISEDEKLMQKVTKTVDCSSTTNQTLAIVMGIMGGAIQCSKPPPFDSFIQKRLNKTAELPALEQ